MADKKSSWRKFQRIQFSTKSLSQRAKKAEAATVRHAHRFIFTRLNNIRNVRRHIAGWMLIIGVLIGAAALQLLWFQRSYTEMAPADGGTYAEAVKGPLETLNPLYATTDAEQSMSRLLFSSLMQYDPSGSLNLDLAESVQRSDAGNVYTVKLRDGARWSDGTKVTASDIVFTVDLLKNPMTRATITGWQDIKINEIDDRTVEFRLPSSYAPFQHALTFPILPKHVLDTIDPSQLRESSFGKNPVGSGPFEFRLSQTVDMTKDRKILHMAANEDYYRGTPKLEKFQLHVYGSQEEIGKAIRTSEVNAAANVSLDYVSEKDKKRNTIHKLPINNGVYALMNTQSDVLKDLDIRKALQYGTDTEAVRDALPNSTRALGLPFLTGQVVSDNLPKPPTVDKQRAAELLDKAGYKLRDDGMRAKGDMPLQIRVATLKSKEYEIALSTIAQQWRELGIDVEAEILDSKDVTRDVLQTVLQPRNFDVLIYELTMGADPDSYAYWHSSQTTRRGLNFSNYASGITDDALASARLRIEPEIRAAKYVAFAEQWLKDVPAIGLYQANTYYIQNPSVSSVDPSSAQLVTPADRYGNVLYWTVRQDSVYKTP